VGFCAIYEHCSGFEFFLPQALSTPAHTQVTQAVGRFAERERIAFYIIEQVGDNL
jgi:hypothetical protein